MKKVYSLKKDILFKNNIYEILSIAVDKKFNIDGYAIKGLFKINGDYLIRENERDDFDIEIPYLNYIEDNYDVEKIKVDIDDFYYEVKDSNHLIVNIDILVDGLEEKKEREEIIEDGHLEQSKRDDIIEHFIEDVEAKGELIEGDDIDPDDEKVQAVVEPVSSVELSENSVIDEVPRPDNKEYSDNGFVTYRVCIIRQGDTLDNILNKYNVSLDTIKKYNTVNELKIGDKLIIPYEKN